MGQKPRIPASIPVMLLAQYSLFAPACFGLEDNVPGMTGSSSDVVASTGSSTNAGNLSETSDQNHSSTGSTSSATDAADSTFDSTTVAATSDPTSAGTAVTSDTIDTHANDSDGSTTTDLEGTSTDSGETTEDVGTQGATDDSESMDGPETDAEDTDSTSMDSQTDSTTLDSSETDSTDSTDTMDTASESTESESTSTGGSGDADTHSTTSTSSEGEVATDTDSESESMDTTDTSDSGETGDSSSLDWGLLVKINDPADPEASGMATMDPESGEILNQCRGVFLGNAKWNSTGTQIAGTRRVDGKDRIWRVDSDCSNFLQVTFHDDPYGQSGAIYFTDEQIWYWRGPSPGVSEMNAITLAGQYLGTQSDFRGSQNRQIGGFDFNPDRTRSCYRLQPPSNSFLGSLHCAKFPDFTEQITLGENPGRMAVSDDGLQVAFYRHDDTQIFVADALRANSSTRVAGCSELVTGYPTFSPDGSTLAYSCHSDGNTDIWKVKLDDLSTKKLTDTPDLDELVHDWRQ